VFETLRSCSTSVDQAHNPQFVERHIDNVANEVIIIARLRNQRSDDTRSNLIDLPVLD
jgi:hypothetical protein